MYFHTACDGNIVKIYADVRTFFKKRSPGLIGRHFTLFYHRRHLEENGIANEIANEIGIVNENGIASEIRDAEREIDDRANPRSARRSLLGCANFLLFGL